ncbi:hypothetical protein PYJP_19300 [Pyrofollis japonicus]|nr:hypothetical protein PYJP_19300 [Pyrofollis japonicus]
MAVLCTLFDEHAEKALQFFKEDYDLIVFVPYDLAVKHGLEALFSATISAYALIRHGFRRARHKGLEALSVLCREKNLGTVAARCGARRNEKVIAILVSSNLERLRRVLETLKAIRCKFPQSSDPLSLTRISVYPIEERLYRIQPS